MTFLESIKSGVAKAEEANQNLKSVAEIFSKLNKELSNYTNGKLKITRTVSIGSKIATIGAEPSESIATDNTRSNVITLTSIQNKQNRTDIAKWRQHINGFPCTLIFEGQEYICESTDDLKEALSELLSSVSFGRALSSALQESNKAQKT